MRVVLQRVNHASVKVAGETVGAISRGLLLLVGFGREDSSAKLKPMAEKLLNMRIFSNPEGRFDHSVLDLKAEVLLVPQFTLLADTNKGRRPDFFSALEPDAATKLFDEFVAVVQKHPLAKVACGKFGAEMQVLLENDGPVTIIVEL